MNRRSRRRWHAAVIQFALVALTAVGVRASAPVIDPLSAPYQARALDPLPGFTRTFPVDLNDAGTVLCRAGKTPAAETRGYLWNDGSLTDLGTLGGESCLPLALDEAGRVAGSAQAEDGTYQPFVWQEGVMTALPLPEGFAGGEARDLLDADRIGGSVTSANGRRAVEWVKGAPVLLPLLAPFPCSRVFGMAEGGFVVGACFPAPDLERRGRAVMWRNGTVTDLGALPGYSFSQARAVNTQGDVVCNSFEPGFPEYGSRYRSGTHTHLLGLIRSEGWDIDEKGVCVGDRDRYQTRGSWGYYGYLWSGARSRAMDVLVTGNAQPIRTVTAINNLQQAIAETGIASLDTSSGSSVLLIPRPAEVSLAMEQVTTPSAPGETVTVRAILSNCGDNPVPDCRLTLYPPAWLAEVSAQSNQGNPTVGPAQATLRVDGLAPGETLILELTGRAKAPGRYVFQSVASSPGIYLTDETSFAIAGSIQPDLAPAPGSLRATQTGSGNRFKINFQGRAQNFGTLSTRPCMVRLYLGAGPVRQRGDRLVRQVRIPALSPGSGKTIEVKYSARRSAMGQYLLMEVDSPSRIQEIDETNNNAAAPVTTAATAAQR